MKSIVILIFLLPSIVNSQPKQGISNNSFDTTFSYLKFELETNVSFKECVFAVENNIGTTKNIDTKIKTLCNLINTHFSNQYSIKYKQKDSINYLINFSIKNLLKDTFLIYTQTSLIAHPPFRFNHTDPLGKKDITNTFVSKLLATHQGNCKSLTYLYKILADELGAKCWIALAPGHMYIKNYSEKIGWYNTELTSGTFPTDAYIMASSYINPTAVMSGMYMDTLSNQQAIALCVLDLAHLYERQTKNYYDGFILKCCDLVLKYHPVNPMALLLKAETLKKQAIREKSSKFPKPTRTLMEMEATYLKLFELGYREMPLKMKRQKQKEEKERVKKYLPKK